MKSNYLPTDYQTFIATSRYARWLEEEGRRETWGETVGRYMTNIVSPWLTPTHQEEISSAILSLEVMPSMRSLMTAGKSSARDNTCMYNCSYLPVDDPKAFDEAMFILLCGTGVGFSVERQFITKLPEVPSLFESDTTIVSRTVRKVGLKVSDKFWLSCGLVRFLSGMYLKYVQRVLDLRRLVVALVVLLLWLIV